MCTSILLSCFLFVNSFVYAANLDIEGVIIDAQTKEAVSFAHIAIKGTSLGSISNEEGAFILSLSSQVVADSISISHISYETKTIALSDLPKNGQIPLTPLVIKGAEITIVGFNDHQIIQQTVSNLISESKKNHLLKGFYRKTAKTEGEYTQALEAFYWVQYGTYNFEEEERTFVGVQNKILREGRVAEVLLPKVNNAERTVPASNESTFNIKNYQQYLALPFALSENGAMLALPLALDYYKFYTAEQVATIGDSIGVFSFKPRIYKGLKKFFAPKNRQKVDSAYVYINLNSFQLVRHQGWFASIPGVSAGSEITGLNLEYDYRFGKSGLPESVSLKSTSPKMSYTNKEGRYFTINKNVEINSTFVFYDFVKNFDPITFSSSNPFLSIKDDSKQLANRRYNPTFWEENQWLKRTEADEAFVSFMQKNGLFRVYN